jgi:flagellar FliL protein
MSDEKDKDKNEEKKGGKIKVLVVVLILIGALFGGGYWAAASGIVNIPGISPPADVEGEVIPEIVLNEEPTFLPLEKFVVGLSERTARSFMVVELALVSHDPRLEDQAKELDSVLRNAILVYFSGKGPTIAREEIANPTKLQSELRHAFMKAASDYGKELSVEKILLTNVIIQ